MENTECRRINNVAAIVKAEGFHGEALLHHSQDISDSLDFSSLKMLRSVIQSAMAVFLTMSVRIEPDNTQTNVSITSRSLSSIPHQILRHRLLPFADLHSVDTFGKTCVKYHRLAEQHIDSVLLENYRDAIETLNLTVNEFKGHFPYFDRLSKPSAKVNGMVRGKVMTMHQESKKERLLLIELRDMTEIKHGIKYLQINLIEGHIDHCSLRINVAGTPDDLDRSTKSLPVIHNRENCVSFVRAAFSGELFSVGDRTHLISIRKRAWWLSPGFHHHLQLRSEGPCLSPVQWVYFINAVWFLATMSPLFTPYLSVLVLWMMRGFSVLTTIILAGDLWIYYDTFFSVSPVLIG